MTPGRIRSDVVAERIAWIREMIASIKRLPLSDYEAFINDPRNSAAAESYLRRAIEALLDLGRHILAKGFGFAVTEYKDIGVKLSETDVISGSQGLLLRKIAGYRNRMVHFYHEVSIRELFDLCTRNVHDIEILLDSFISWIRGNPGKMDQPW
jgi:uncharacterized protein YutE (UPF0331/DUF86 family)